MNLLTVDTVENAWDKIKTVMQGQQPGIEHIGLESAINRILAEDIIAAENVPGFRRSIVDGYALHSADTAAAGDSIPVMLKLCGSVEMGEAAGFSINSGECAYVPTGGMIPAGADAVAMIEYAEQCGKNIAVYEAVAPGKGLAQADEDLRQGELVLQRGTCLRPQETGLLASLGIEHIPVFKKLRLALFSTGNELAAANEKLRPGKIRDINTNFLAALAEQRGFHVIKSAVIPDDAQMLENAVRSSLNDADIIAVSGGSSRGDRDYTAQVFLRITENKVFTQGLALKPGKPAIFGFEKKTSSLLCGLPGHPVSAFFVFELFLSRLYRSLSFQKEVLPVQAFIDRNIPGAEGKTCCQPVILRQEANAIIAEPVFGKSGMISSLTRADAYIIIDQNKEGIKKGDLVWACRL